jgi:uncharacterized membrane protein
MTLFVTGLVLFFVPHFYSAVRGREAGKDIQVRMGKAAYMGLYSVVTLIGFVLMIKGYGDMRPAKILYSPPAIGQHLNMGIMVAAMILLIASQFPAGHIKKRAKHPMLLAVKLWALGHLISNGELNSVLLFGTFLVFAIFDRVRVKRRGDVGAANAIADPKWDIVALIVGLGLYAALVMGLHQWAFGVQVMAL